MVKHETKLKELIRKSGYRNDHIAEFCGIETDTLKKIAGGYRKTSRPVIKLLALILNVKEQELIGLGLLQSEAS